MSNSFSDAVNKILSENKSININQSGKTLMEKVNDVQIDRDGQDKFHREKKLLGPSRFKKWFKRRTLKKSDMTDQEQEQHHQDNRKLAASGVKEDVTPGSVEMVYGKHKVINTGNEDRYGFEMYNVHHGGKKTHSNVRLSTAKEVLNNARKKTTEKANRKLENPKESVELDEAQRPTRTAVNQEFKRVHGKQMDTGAATRHVEKKFNINNVKVQKDNDGNRHVISFDESVELGESDGHHYHVTNIDYETDGNEKIKKSLPKSMKVHVPHDVVKDGEYAITDHINDHISDETGWLHHGYDMKRVKGKTRKESVEVDESNFGYRSAKVRGPIDVTAYRDSHGKRPYHAEEGNWYFSAEPGGKPVHKSGPNTTYRNAKKGAEEFANKNNHKKLYVMASYDATSAADDFLNELSQEFGAENITLDTIMENISELETLLTSLKEYFGIDESAEGDTILTAHDMASTNDPYEHQAMAVQKIKDLINKERNEETTKESNNGK